MLRCKHVSDALSEEHYSRMPWYRQMGLKMHVCLCVFCGKYHRQVLWFQKGVDRYLENEQEPCKHSTLRMDPETKSRIKTMMDDEGKPAMDQIQD